MNVDPVPSAGLVDLLVARLVRDHGGTKHNWRKVIGPVHIYDRTRYAHCNWNITPTGPASDIAQVEAALDDLRLTYPILKL